MRKGGRARLPCRISSAITILPAVPQPYPFTPDGRKGLPVPPLPYSTAEDEMGGKRIYLAMGAAGRLLQTANFSERQTG
jgi:hypothetical protein